MVQYKLYYFNARGRAELARLLLAAADEQYEDIRLEKDAWPQHKANMPFGQMPVLDVTNDNGEVTQLAQIYTICRFLANRLNLAGASELEKAKVDMIVDQFIDVESVQLKAYKESDEEKKKANYEEFFTVTLPANFTFFEKILEANGSGYFVGADLTWADIVAYVILERVDNKLGQLYEKFPLVYQNHQKVRTNPRIAAWLAKRPVTEF